MTASLIFLLAVTCSVMAIQAHSQSSERHQFGGHRQSGCCTKPPGPIICIDLNLGERCRPNNKCILNLGRLLKIEGTCVPGGNNHHQRSTSSSPSGSSVSGSPLSSSATMASSLGVSTPSGSTSSGNNPSGSTSSGNNPSGSTPSDSVSSSTPSDGSTSLPPCGIEQTEALAATASAAMNDTASES